MSAPAPASPVLDRRTAPRRTGVRRWIGYVALTLLFAIVCGLLSWWQWSRRAERVAAIEIVEANYDAAAAPLDDVLPDDGAWTDDAEWRPVALTGEYLVDEQLLVRNRPRNGGPGWEVLTPLRTDDGRVFIVDRGWLPLGSRDDLPETVPDAPSGVVDVVVRLKAGEPELPGRSAPDGQISTIHLPDVAERVAASGESAEVVAGAYGLLASESPAPASSPLPATRPVADEGSHLSYAFQWIAFGVLAIVALIWAVRHERRAQREEELAAAEGRPVAAPKRARSVDADEEDALLDAAGR